PGGARADLAAGQVRRVLAPPGGAVTAGAAFLAGVGVAADSGSGEFGVEFGDELVEVAGVLAGRVLVELLGFGSPGARSASRRAGRAGGWVRPRGASLPGTAPPAACAPVRPRRGICGRGSRRRGPCAARPGFAGGVRGSGRGRIHPPLASASI